MAFDAGSVIAKIKADLTDFQAGINKVKEGAQTMADKVKGSIAGMNTTIKDMTPQLQKASLAVGAVGAAGVLILRDWTEAAAGAEVQMAQFNATMDTMGASGQAAKGALLDAASAAVKLGFDDEDSAVSLATLYQKTGDVNDAMKLNALAMDLARAKSIDLNTATNLVGQVLSGNGRVLKQYGIDIKDSATPMEALGVLSDKVAGQSAAFADTFNGKMAAMGVQIGNLKESLGAALIPIFEQLLAVGQKVIDWLNALSPQAIKIIAIVVLLTTVAALLLAPLLILITLIPPIIAGFTLLMTPVGLAILGIGALIAVFVALGVIIVTNLQQFKDFFTILTQRITDFFGWVGTEFNTGVKYVQDAWQSMMNFISSITSSVLSGIQDTFKNGINYLLGLVQSVLDTYNSVVTKVGLGRIAAPPIKKLAEGGIVTRPTIAMIGEGGESEAVIPLSKMGGVGGGIHIHLENAQVWSKEGAVELLDAAMRRVQPRLGL